MPAKAGIHTRGTVIMDSGFRRNDKQGDGAIPVMATRPWELRQEEHHGT